MTVLLSFFSPQQTPEDCYPVTEGMEILDFAKERVRDSFALSSGLYP